MAVYIYKTIVENKKIFIEAPTGTGKTISSLFPAVKAIGEGKSEKIFYLTAKTTTKHIAEEAINRMKAGNVRIKAITLTAKDKICFKEEKNCNPVQCEFAKGHFDRVNEAIWSIINEEDSLNRETIEEYARKYNVCPFEFSLDLSLWCECIICDYNYVFDPRASLKRFFETSGEFIFLIDEAHNLVDRARSMYSAELFKSEYLRLKKLMSNEDKQLSRSLNNINRAMLKYKKQLEQSHSIVIDTLPEEMYSPLNKFVEIAEKWLVENEKNENHQDILQAYFDVNSFLRIWEMYDQNFVTCVQDIGGDTKIKLFCVNPSNFIADIIKKGVGAALFSATMIPMNYYRTILGADEKDYTARLGSPYSKENLGLFIANTVSTRYRDRESSKDYVVEYIKTITSYKKGNYIVFFPSYKYMMDIYELFKSKVSDIELIVQNDSMNESDREDFIESFKEETQKSMVAFAVLGGMFSEGIDLKGNRLIGAVIVGVGLPQICFERDIIKDFFQTKDGLGYEFAYLYPGMCKVLQAAGRVIRTAEDKGVVLLIDDRFTSREYLKMFPEHWKHFETINSKDELQRKLKYFWK